MNTILIFATLAVFFIVLFWLAILNNKLWEQNNKLWKAQVDTNKLLYNRISQK